MGKRLVEVDTVTVLCNSCHDGTVASNVLEGFAKGPLRPHGFGRPGSNHPVEVLYPPVAPEYRPLAELDPRLPLLKGKVVCTTCHALTGDPRALRIPMRRSELCLACHLK